MVPPRKTLSVPHLGGITVGYRLSSVIPSKPTLVLIIPFTTTVDYYLPEFENTELTSHLNLLAIEPLGHGETRAKSETFTYWDTAIMALQLLDALGIEKAFASGTSQGGWIAARMALLAPEKIQGLVFIGTSMDGETPRTRELGCWDGAGATSALVTLGGNLTPVPDFEPGDAYYDFLMEIGYGKTVPRSTRDFWANTIKNTYQGDDGKRRICMAAIALATRDGLHARLPYIRCPVLWLQGTGDIVFSATNAQEEIKLFTNAKEAKLVTFPDGVHFLSFTHPREVHQNFLDFTSKWQSAKL